LSVITWKTFLDQSLSVAHPKFQTSSK